MGRQAGRQRWVRISSATRNIVTARPLTIVLAFLAAASASSASSASTSCGAHRTRNVQQLGFFGWVDKIGDGFGDLADTIVDGFEDFSEDVSKYIGTDGKPTALFKELVAKAVGGAFL